MFFIIILVLIISISIYGSKFKSPYTLNFIFGKKGSGKSTYMVKLMLYYIKKGWNVYTDIPDVVIPGVKIISDAKLLGQYTTEPHSAIFLDEGGITFNSRNFKQFTNEQRSFYKLQRKYHVTIWVNSQSWDIDKQLRELCDSLYLCNNLLGCFCLIRPIKRSITLTEPTSDSESRIADRLKFGGLFSWKIIFLPRFFKYFNSFNAPDLPVIDFKQIPPKKLKDAIKDD